MGDCMAITGSSCSDGWATARQPPYLQNGRNINPWRSPRNEDGSEGMRVDLNRLAAHECECAGGEGSYQPVIVRRHHDGHPLAMQAREEQIGRASCRERA